MLARNAELPRRSFLKKSALALAALAARPLSLAADENATLLHPSLPPLPAAQASDWLQRWRRNILDSSRDRYCDKATGEDLGWLMSPFLDGFYYGYTATGDSQWVARFADWTNSWLKRATKDPSGFPSWPNNDPGSGVGDGLLADSLLGEAMALRPVVKMAALIRQTSSLRQEYAADARRWLDTAARVFEKWESFDAWRPVKGGGLWVVPAFGLDPATGRWSKGYEDRATTGFSNPDNKENHIARWLLAMHDVTGNAIYRERAEMWFRLMKTRIRPNPWNYQNRSGPSHNGDKCVVWNYWEPAGPWDYKPDGSPRHWIGVHPNGGYYYIDVEAITEAFEHHLVFTSDDLERLIATNRDFMWDHHLHGAHFKRIDGGAADPRWKDTPGVLWTSLIPYDATLRNIFVANFDPASWSGLAVTPWFLSRSRPA